MLNFFLLPNGVFKIVTANCQLFNNVKTTVKTVLNLGLKGSKHLISTLILGGSMGHCFTWHVQVSLGFYFNFKTEELVHSVLCAMWHLGHNSTRIKILPWKIDGLLLYLWLLEITKVRIKFQNYLFKADKRISHHLGHNRIFPADRIRILLWKINRLLLHF